MIHLVIHLVIAGRRHTSVTLSTNQNLCSRPPAKPFSRSLRKRYRTLLCLPYPTDSIHSTLLPPYHAHGELIGELWLLDHFRKSCAIICCFSGFPQKRQITMRVLDFSTDTPYFILFFFATMSTPHILRTVTLLSSYRQGLKAYSAPSLFAYNNKKQYNTI